MAHINRFIRPFKLLYLQNFTGKNGSRISALLCNDFDPIVVLRHIWKLWVTAFPVGGNDTAFGNRPNQAPLVVFEVSSQGFSLWRQFESGNLFTFSPGLIGRCNGLLN